MSTHRYLVVAYDIPSDRRRARLARLLEGFLEHVQESVFEGPIDDGKCERLRRAIGRAVDPGRDAVRIYSLCRRCRGATEVIGVGMIVEDEPEDIVL
ncbi:MAG: CRISPR-associated endonuclease Cas2 [Acidobacteriota bacterium]|jgi:CRISPR-associated protein Cas2|nr:CRISPR-associated endonuclease Cas2 [Acidobacteriota bacterium]